MRVSEVMTRDVCVARPDHTIEDVARNWTAINDEAAYSVPADLTEWSTVFLAHLRGAATG